MIFRNIQHLGAHMGIYIILCLILIKSALTFGDGYCNRPEINGTEWCFVEQKWKCISAIDCGENDVWNKPHSATAIGVEFHLRMSLSLIKVLSKDAVLQKVEDFLENKMHFNTTDMFGLKTYPSHLMADTDSSALKFSLQPGTSYVTFPIENLRSFQDCTFFCKNNTVEMFGNEISIIGGHFNVEPEDWSGLKSIVTFDLMIEYNRLESIGMLQAENAVATFLHETVDLRSRDIYDLMILNSVTKSTVQFSLPPIIEHDLQSLLQSIDLVINQPCIELCMEGASSHTENECNTCDSVSLSGTNVYPLPRSLHSKFDGWAGTEIRFKKVTIGTAVCNEHQEACKNNRGITECVGIGICDNHFYKNLEVTLLVHGQLLLFDVNGLDFALNAIEETLENLFNFCKGSIKAEIFDTGRTTTGIRLVIAPSISRAEGITGLDNMVLTQDSIRVMDLDISKVDGTYTKKYLDANKPVRYLDDHACFDCSQDEVWCITRERSLCLQKNQCIAENIKQLKLADDTDLIRISFLVQRSKNIDLSDDVKFDIKFQIIDIIGCFPEQVRDFQIVPYETLILEVGFELLNRGNRTELAEQLYRLRLKCETEDLVLYTNEDDLRSLENSFLFRQLIFGHEKHVVATKKSGNDFVTASGLFILVVFILAVLGKMIIKKRSTWKSKANDKKTG